MHLRLILSNNGTLVTFSGSYTKRYFHFSRHALSVDPQYIVNLSCRASLYLYFIIFVAVAFFSGS